MMSTKYSWAKANRANPAVKSFNFGFKNNMFSYLKSEYLSEISIVLYSDRAKEYIYNNI